MRQIFRDEALERQFRHQGYVIVPLLDSATVNRLQEFFDETATPKIAGFHGTMYHNDPEYRKRIDKVIRGALAPNFDRWLIDYRPCLCNFMTKEPDDDSGEMPLHQDWSHVAEPEYRSVHAWCPLVDVDHDNGCLAVVPGSQHLSDSIRAFADDCPFREQFTLIREKYLYEVPIKAGSAVLFDGRLLHCSAKNTSGKRRVTAQAITVPKEIVMHHAQRVSESTVEIYEVTDEFFFDYVLHEPARGVEANERVEYVPRQLTSDQVNELQKYQPEAPAATSS